MRPQPSISQCRDTNRSRFGNYPCSIRMFGGFLQCEILNMQRKGAFPYMLNSISTWNLKDHKDLWSTLGCSISTIFKIIIVWFTRRWEKFTQSCLCESPFNRRAKFAFHLQEPRMSSPSICVTLIVQTDPEEYFKIASTSSYRFLDWVAICKSRSLSSSPWLSWPPCLKW